MIRFDPAFKITVGLFLIILIGNSCTTYKNVPYFADLSDTGKLSLQAAVFKEPVIQADDILAINIETIDANNPLFESSNTNFSGNLNAPSAGGATVPSLVQGSGYLVDKEGNIELPVAGKLHVAGLTRMEARDSVKNRVALYVKNTTVDLRFANFKITVLGEVLRPSSFTVPNEKVTIFDALGMAGDMTIYGKRENVVLVRDSGNIKNLVRLNLNSKDIVSSPYFYLKQNDVVYVEPSDRKAASLDAARNRTFAILASGISLLIVLATRL